MSKEIKCTEFRKNKAMGTDRIPLNWVRTFELVARLNSFQHAAAALHITPGAVSQQIRKLEHELGQTLFQRTQNPVKLTVAGQALFDRVERPVYLIEEALTDSRQLSRGSQVEVWGSRFFMRHWLLPRLHEFHELKLGFSVDLTTAQPMASVPTNCDIAIRVGADMNGDLHSEVLLQRVAVPVCSREYLFAKKLPVDAADYPAHHLLKGSMHDDEWRTWLVANGLESPHLPNVTTMSSSDLVYAAALEGVGIALGRLGFVDKDLASGRLIRLHGAPVDLGLPFCLHYRKDRASDPKIRAFATWLRREVANGSSGVSRLR